MLEHREADCTGEWRLVALSDEYRIVCARCGAGYAATPSHKRAAVDENLAGAFLRRLAEEGAGPDLDNAA
jgi:hypothetical protein